MGCLNSEIAWPNGRAEGGKRSEQKSDN
jgi:hypothetical protein